MLSSLLLCNLVNLCRFLLATLHFGSLIGKKSIKAIRNALDNLVTGSGAYDSAYTAAMERIGCQVPDQAELAKQVLAWIIHAKRQLTASELREALGVEIGHDELDLENCPDVDDMVSACAGLVIVDEASHIIRLVHYTTQEYFERTQHNWFPEADAMITSICTTYLSFPVFARRLSESDDRSYHFEGQFYALYNYAVSHWGHHAYLAPSTLMQVMNFLDRLDSVNATAYDTYANGTPDSYWVAIFCYHESARLVESIKPLHLAAYFGLEAAASAILKENVDVDVRDSNDTTPLILAASNGHDRAVQLLLDYGAVVDQCDIHGRTPLFVAVYAGHVAVVKTLLDNGADVYATRTGDKTPLHMAAEKGSLAIVQLLLGANADVNAVDRWKETPLHGAAEEGHPAVVQLLLDANAVVNAINLSNKTPLHVAVEEGHPAVVQLLLDANAVVNAINISNKTPLHVAAGVGHPAVVQLLLDANANVNAIDFYEQTALHCAACYGHDAVGRLLLKAGADSSIRGAGGQTALHIAVTKEGNFRFIELLLAYGSSRDDHTKEDKNVLLLAAQNNTQNVVQPLLEISSDVNCQDVDGNSPLHMVHTSADDQALFELLIKHGADINLRNNDGWTPLMVACYYDRLIEAGLLLQSGADVHCTDSHDRSALFFAARSVMSGSLVNLLLNYGADATHRDELHRSPLFCMLQSPYTTAIKILLDAGVNPCARDVFGDTASSFAWKHIRQYIQNDSDADDENDVTASSSTETANQDLPNIEEDEEYLDRNWFYTGSSYITDRDWLEKVQACIAILDEAIEATQATESPNSATPTDLPIRQPLPSSSQS
jgi:ankyrin repeat protein